ncbi:MAG: hypothetical protein KGS73_02825 [Chloroflexi bacterium]|nr:hypothetical protein [Chloroflexota bacterium]
MNWINRQVASGAGWLAIGGGLLWIGYAVASLSGGDAGSGALFSMPAFNSAVLGRISGGGALLLLGLAVAGTAARYGLPSNTPEPFYSTVPSRFGVAMGWVGALAGLLAGLAALLHIEPAYHAMQLFGALLVPIGATLVAIDANRHETTCPIAAPLFLVGALGLVGLLAQALMPAASWMQPVYAALVLAVGGFVWVRFGTLLTLRRP